MFVAIFFILIVIFAIIVARDAKNFIHTKNHQKKVNNSIQLGMEYLSNSILSSGRITCVKNIKKGFTYGQEFYDTISHAGTLYSLYTLEKLLDINVLKEKRMISSLYFIKEYIKKLDNGMYAVVSKPKEDSMDNPVAKLGASGLALASLSNLCGELISLDILTRIADFIISMQLPGGWFNSVYDIKTQAVVEHSAVMHYQGQAVLGLLSLYEIYPNPKYINSAKKALLFLANSRKDKKTVPFDYWAMIATEKLFHYASMRLSKDEKKLLQKHIIRMTDSVINDQIRNKENPFNGAFQHDTRPSSIAPIMEGFIATFNCFEIEDLDTRQPLMRAIYAGTNFLRHQQLQSGRAKGGLPSSSDWREVGVPEEASMVKIDTVYHALNVWVKFQGLFR